MRRKTSRARQCLMRATAVAAEVGRLGGDPRGGLGGGLRGNRPKEARRRRLGRRSASTRGGICGRHGGSDCLSGGLGGGGAFGLSLDRELLTSLSHPAIGEVGGTEGGASVSARRGMSGSGLRRERWDEPDSSLRNKRRRQTRGQALHGKVGAARAAVAVEDAEETRSGEGGVDGSHVIHHERTVLHVRSLALRFGDCPWQRERRHRRRRGSRR